MMRTANLLEYSGSAVTSVMVVSYDLFVNFWKKNL